MPDCLPENEDAEKIYFVVQDQLILGGMGGMIGLNQVAIHMAMNLYDVEFKRDCFEKVVKAGRYFVKKQSDEAKDKKQ